MNAFVARSVPAIAGTFLVGIVFSVCLHGQETPNAVIVTPTTPAQLEVQQIGETAINRLAVSMTNEVKSALRGGDPADAIDMCHLKGLPTTPGQMINGMPRIIAIKFTSLKLRSQENSPDPSDTVALEYIKGTMENATEVPSVVVQRIDIPNSAPEWRVYKPIGISASCLVCHGDPAEQPERVRSRMKALYPDDQANGYKTREWRGVIRVTVADGPAQ